MMAHVIPTAIIGIGKWGAAVALRTGELLKERSPGLALACPVLTLGHSDQDAPDQVRKLLRSIRRADLMKRLQGEGLLLLDPLVGPPTQVCLITSLEGQQDLSLLREIGDHAAEALSELRVTVSLAAVAWLQTSQVLSPGAIPFPLYVTEPITSLGLLLDQAEYDEAIAQVLIASVQPGCGRLLHTGRPGLGTVGVAWLDRGAEHFVPHLADRAIARLAESLGRTVGGKPKPDGGSWSQERRLAVLTRSIPFRLVAGRLVCEGKAGLSRDPRGLLPDWERRVLEAGKGQEAVETAALREAAGTLARSAGIPTAIAWLERLRAGHSTPIEITPSPPRKTWMSRIGRMISGRQGWEEGSQRVEGDVAAVITRELERLDDHLHEASAHLADRLHEVLEHLARSPEPQQQAYVPHRPMIKLPSADELVAEITDRLAADPDLLWQPVKLRVMATGEARSMLGRAQSSSLTQGEAAADWLEQVATDLILWSQPLLSSVRELPEGRSYLIWPQGLPVPPLPDGAELIPHAISSSALLTVVEGISSELSAWLRLSR